jgi:Cu-Zn family superoxide dismutase
MKRLGFFTVVLPVVLVVFALPGVAKTRVELKDAQGKAVGTVLVWQQGPGVGLQLNLHGLPPGEHAIHFHTNAKCDTPDFKSAGAHLNPENKASSEESVGKSGK